MKLKKLTAIIAAAALTVAALAAPAFADTEAERYINYSLSHMNNINLVNIERWTAETEEKPEFTQSEDGKYGLSLGDRVITETIWDDVQLNTESGRLFASLGDENPGADGGYYNSASLQGDYEPSPETVSVKRDGMWGAVSKETGEIVIEPAYNEVCEINGIIRIMDFDGKYGYADKIGNIIIEPQYDYVSAFSRSRLADFESEYTCETTIVGRDYGYTVLNLVSKEELIPLTTDKIHIQSNDYFTVVDNQNLVSRLFDRDGSLLLELEDTSDIEMVSDNRFLIAKAEYTEPGADGSRTIKNETDRLIDSEGNVILDGSNYYSLMYQGGDNPVFIACARGSAQTKAKSGEYLSGFDMFDSDGEPVCSVDAGEMSVHSGTIRIYEDGKWGLINSCGEEILPCEYDEISFPFVMKDGKTGVINNVGEFVVDPVWDGAMTKNCSVIELEDRVCYAIQSMNGTYLASDNGDIIAGPYVDIKSLDGRLVLTLPAGGYKVTARVVNTSVPIAMYNLIDVAVSETAGYLAEIGVAEQSSLSDLSRGLTCGQFLEMLAKADGMDNDILKEDSGIVSDSFDPQAPLTAEKTMRLTAAALYKDCAYDSDFELVCEIWENEVMPYAPCYLSGSFAADFDAEASLADAMAAIQAFNLSADRDRDSKTKHSNPIENIIAYYFF